MNNETAPEAPADLSQKIVYGLGILVSLLHIYFNIFSVLPTLTQNALHYSGFAVLCALVYPLRSSVAKERSAIELYGSFFFGIIAACSALYLISMEDSIYARGVHLSTGEWIAGVLL
ncbi:MAG: hypothetical protein P8X39_04225, partial [Desulfofustis sp.]